MNSEGQQQQTSPSTTQSASQTKPGIFEKFKDNLIKIFTFPNHSPPAADHGKKVSFYHKLGMVH